VAAGLVATGVAWGATQTFTYTGGEQTYTVPEGVSTVLALAVGGKAGGRGAQVTGGFGVFPGEKLYIEVGGNGTFGEAFNGGGRGNGGSGGGGVRCAHFAASIRLVARHQAARRWRWW
jgi:hypothetical protein